MQYTNNEQGEILLAKFRKLVPYRVSVNNGIPIPELAREVCGHVHPFFETLNEELLSPRSVDVYVLASAPYLGHAYWIMNERLAFLKRYYPKIRGAQLRELLALRVEHFSGDITVPIVAAGDTEGFDHDISYPVVGTHADKSTYLSLLGGTCFNGHSIALSIPC